jgi:hypothetical protein
MPSAGSGARAEHTATIGRPHHERLTDRGFLAETRIARGTVFLSLDIPGSQLAALRYGQPSLALRQRNQDALARQEITPYITRYVSGAACNRHHPPGGRRLLRDNTLHAIRLRRKHIRATFGWYHSGRHRA